MPSMKQHAFKERVEAIQQLVADVSPKTNPYIKAVEHKECLGRHHVEAELKKMNAAGAEGLMLRKPKSADFVCLFVSRLFVSGVSHGGPEDDSKPYVVR